MSSLQPVSETSQPNAQPIQANDITAQKDILSIDVQRKLPKWDLGSVERRERYYTNHGETWLDCLIRFIAWLFGIIVHQSVDEDQLKENLEEYDIQALLSDGPYESAILSLQAQALIKESLESFPRVIDIHLHNLGYDEGNYLNPSISSEGSWMDFFTFAVLRYASGMTSPIGSTHEARRRIQLYAEHFPKLDAWILPIQKARTETGEADWEHTGNFLTNRSAWETAQTFSSPASTLHAAVSIHPGDPKWLQKLIKAYDRGIRLVKWMPPQGIRPDNDRYIPFYQAMAERKMILIAHAGPEHVLSCKPEWDDWGNPLRFREALQAGVDVIFAHSGHRDMIPDLDNPDSENRPGYELFARVAREAHSNQWLGKVYGDLAAVTTHYGPEFVKELLLLSREPGMRFIYGSDYPYTNLMTPCTDPYKLMAHHQLLDPNLVRPLREIRNWNPLLANYIFTKCLSFQTEAETITFPEATFTGEFEDAPLSQLICN